MSSLLVLELLFVVNPYSLFLQFSKAQKFEKEEKCCNLFLLCMGKTQRLLSDMVANKTHQRAPPLLQVAFQTFERRPFDKWTNDLTFKHLGTFQLGNVHIPMFKIGKYTPDFKVWSETDLMSQFCLPYYDWIYLPGRGSWEELCSQWLCGNNSELLPGHYRYRAL